MSQERFSRSGILVCVGAAAVLLAFVLLRPDTAEPEVDYFKGRAPVETLLSELDRRDGTFLEKGSSNLYTGWVVERYGDGVLKSRTEVVDGRLAGVSEGYYTNGQMQVREFFTNGVSHGVRTKWRMDGSKLSEGEIVAGEFNGVFRKWHENGKLHQRVEMSNGVPQGVSRGWYRSGYLQSRVVLDKGKVVKREDWQDNEKREEPGILDKD